jgi:hypothetical protein
MLFAFVPRSVSKRANAGSALVVELVLVRDPPAVPAVVAGTDELVWYALCHRYLPNRSAQ